MITDFLEKQKSKYNFKLKKFTPISPCSFSGQCEIGNKYFIKKTNLYTEEKLQFLYNQGINNILFPLKNISDRYVTNIGRSNYFISDYIPDFHILDEVKFIGLNDELKKLHFNTAFKRQLQQSKSRQKMDDIYNVLEYKFTTLELFIRSVEARAFDEYSIVILKNYASILDAKKVIGKYHRKLISAVKEQKSVNFAFIHNNPKLEHLLVSGGHHFLTSIENSKIGIPSLDMAKLYIENENVNIDLKSIIVNYFDKFDDDFYFDYFIFLVLLYYIKSIIIIEKDYVTAQSIATTSKSLKRFLNLFIYENET